MSDFYVESSDQVAVFEGAAGQPPGRVTLQSPKIHLPAQTNQAPVFEVSGYAGQIYCGQSQFYCEPVETRIQISGQRPAQMTLAGNFWYRNGPVFDLGAAGRLTLLGNTGASDSESARLEMALLSPALDDLRRLGQLDFETGQAQK
jgi:hypothetical protein